MTTRIEAWYEIVTLTCKSGRFSLNQFEKIIIATPVHNTPKVVAATMLSKLMV